MAIEEQQKSSATKVDHDNDTTSTTSTSTSTNNNDNNTSSLSSSSWYLGGERSVKLLFSVDGDFDSDILNKVVPVPKVVGELALSIETLVSIDDDYTYGDIENDILARIASNYYTRTTLFATDDESDGEIITKRSSNRDAIKNIIKKRKKEETPRSTTTTTITTKKPDEPTLIRSSPFIGEDKESDVDISYYSVPNPLLSSSRRAVTTMTNIIYKKNKKLEIPNPSLLKTTVVQPPIVISPPESPVSSVKTSTKIEKKSDNRKRKSPPF